MAEVQKGIPQIGLKFRTPDEAWQFWVAYGGRTGFDVRKRYTNVSKRKPTKSPAPTKKRAKQQKQGDDVLQPQVELENDDSNKSVVAEFQDYNALLSS